MLGSVFSRLPFWKQDDSLRNWLHGNTFVFGDYTRCLLDCFENYDRDGYLNIEETRRALNELKLYPTKSQVYEILYCSSDYEKHEKEKVSFAQFCVLASELREGYKKGMVGVNPFSRKDKDEIIWKRQKRKVTGIVTNFQVFLGGACNPTQWRTTEAIPFLKQHCITYYNPQVPNWTPELVEIEDQAKHIAEVLLFVINNKTRCIASLVEAAYLAGCGRQLLLVLIPLVGPEIVIAGETISKTDLESLQRGHEFLHDLVERCGLPVFADIPTALQCTAHVLQKGQDVSELTLRDGVQPVRYTHVRVGDKYMKLGEAFNHVDVKYEGSISIEDVTLACKTLTNCPLDSSFQKILKHSNKKSFSFEEFCCLVTEIKYGSKGFFKDLFKQLYSWSWKISSSRALREDMGDNVFSRRDVFLGGSCGESTWRKDVAIPMLRKEGLSFFNPQMPKWSARYIPMEANTKNNCRLLLFVISSDTRATAAMLEAGFYVGLGCEVVLCIQCIPKGAVIEGEMLTPLAVKDYNRGRMYLTDVANRDGVPVFDNVAEAVQCVIDRLRTTACSHANCS
ncbi:uncharacterized protein LOC135501216 isoform X2 [Lineus longissimus]|uniref:uncharacterized protein LOC135501216 isoform X2 n=1 Tax=Lineus longissimus TaxID=88925 RepID=UPI002B4E42E6